MNVISMQTEIIRTYLRFSELQTSKKLIKHFKLNKQFLRNKDINCNCL
jgi:hypothetical protein